MDSGANKIHADCDIVENFFGRETQLWNISDVLSSLAETLYVAIILICRSLTSYHIPRRALCDEVNVLFQEKRRLVYAQGQR